MTIQRTRQGKVPDGGPEAGRTIIQLGGLFVEYSGAVPDQADLDAHLNPPVAKVLTVDSLADALKAKGVVSQADIDAAKK